MVGGEVFLLFGGDGQKPRRLVDDDDFVVLIEQVKGEGRLYICADRGDGNGLSRPQGVVKLGHCFAVHLHLSLRQQVFDVVAGFALYLLQQKGKQGVFVFRHEGEGTGRLFDAVVLFFHGVFSFSMLFLFFIIPQIGDKVTAFVRRRAQWADSPKIRSQKVVRIHQNKRKYPDFAGIFGKNVL